MNFWWIWAIFAIIAALWLWGIITQIIMGKPWGTNPAPNSVLLLFGFIPALGFFILKISKLITEVREDGLYYKFYPFHVKFKKIEFNTITKYESRTYKAIREFGGWGIRCNFKGQQALIVHGNIGVEFTIKNYRKLLIGTDKPDSFLDALNKAMKQ